MVAEWRRNAPYIDHTLSRTIMSAKGLFADTLAGVGPDPNAPLQLKNAPALEPMSSVVSTWRGSGEHLVVHVEQPELSSLVSTQRGSGAYAKLTTIDYHTSISPTQTLPLGTRVDTNTLVEPLHETPAPVTPRLSTLPSSPVSSDPVPDVGPQATAPLPANESLPPNVVSIPATQPARRSSKRVLSAVAAALVSTGALFVPVPSHPTGSLVPVSAVAPQAIHAPTQGTVGKLHVSLGHTVAPGQVLVSLDESERSQKAERLRLRIDQLESERDQLLTKDQRLHQAALAALRQKRALIGNRLAQYTDKNGTQRPAPSQAGNARSDAELQLRQQLADIDFLRNDRQQAFEQRKRNTESLLSDAHAELLELKSVELAARATVSARVTRLLVQPGQPVTPGSALVELTPLDAPTKLVGFVPEHAVSRINPEGPVTLTSGNELSHPADASYTSRITYLAPAAAPTDEVQKVLGLVPNETMRRVELAWPEPERAPLPAALSAESAPALRVRATFTGVNEALGVHLWRSIGHFLGTD